MGRAASQSPRCIWQWWDGEEALHVCLEGKQGNADEFVSHIPLLCCIVNYEAFYVAVWNCHALVGVDALSTVISHSSWLSLLTFFLRVVNGKEAGLSHCMLMACKGARSEQATGSWWE